MRSENSPPVAPLVEDVLNAAHEVAAAGLEMDSRVEDELRAALLHLVRAVYAHEDAVDLQRELEADGVREPPIFDVTADQPPATSYAARVERIIATADRVATYTAAPDADPLPSYALAPVCSLVEAVTAYQAHPSAARQWQRAGNRPSLLSDPNPLDTPPPTSGSATPRRAASDAAEMAGQTFDLTPDGDTGAPVKDLAKEHMVLEATRAAPRVRVH